MSRGCQDCGRHVGTVLRVGVAINFLAGICLIAFGAAIQFPVQSLPAVSMILLGVLCLLSGIVGILASGKRKLWLTVYLGLGGVSTLLQMILVICLFADYTEVLASVSPSNLVGSRFDLAHVEKALNTAKGLLLVFVILEFIDLGLALALRLMPDDQAYGAFDAETEQERMISMQSLRTDLERGRNTSSNATTTNKIYDKIRSKMASKYGQFSHGVEWKKKSFFSFS